MSERNHYVIEVEVTSGLQPKPGCRCAWTGSCQDVGRVAGVINTALTHLKSLGMTAGQAHVFHWTQTAEVWFPNDAGLGTKWPAWKLEGTWHGA